ncbi:MAG: aminoacyl-tRNA hydrolase [Panacagrimonas sp.]
MSDADKPLAIIGLGNPGPDYAHTRHNVGFWLVDALADKLGVSLRADRKFFGEWTKLRWQGREIFLLKPQTFMNRSGQSVAALASYFKLKPDQLLIVHDELDLPTGTLRLKRGGGHGGHNGLRDIHKSQGEAYRRLRIGIGHPGDKNLVLSYVLARPAKKDETLIRHGLAQAIDALSIWVDQSWDKAVQGLHSAPTSKA